MNIEIAALSAMREQLAEDRNLRLLLDNAQLALAPFAAAGALVPPDLDENGNLKCPDSIQIITLGNAPGPYVTLTIGHLREAAKAMKVMEKPC